MSGVEALRLMGERASLTCEARVEGLLISAGWTGGIDVVGEPGGEAMAAMVRRRVEVGEWSDVGLIDANYLRRTDAEVKLGAAHTGGFAKAVAGGKEC